MHRWTVTFRKTKNGRDHTLPLTSTLKAIVLKRISYAIDGRLFPLFDPKVVTKHVQRQCGLHITPHDLRRTFAGVAEVAGIGGTMKKDLLNHLSGRDVTDDYTGQSDMDDLRDAMERIEAKMMVFAQPTEPASATQEGISCPSTTKAPSPQIAPTPPKAQPLRRILATL